VLADALRQPARLGEAPLLKRLLYIEPQLFRVKLVL
jgi:hypothetical protein